MNWFLRIQKVLILLVIIVAILVAGIFVYCDMTLYKVGAVEEGYLALTGATVLAGEDLISHNNTSVLIRNGTIIEVGDDGTVEIPYMATVIDLSGYTLMPGLIDMHVHMGSPAQESDDRIGFLTMPKLILDYIRFLPDTRRAFLDSGVTTVRDLGNEHSWIMELRSQLNSDDLEGPRLFAAGPVFTTAGGHPVATFGVDPESDSVRIPKTPDEARHAVYELATGDNRVDLIKVVQERGKSERKLEPIAPGVLDAIVTGAHGQGLFVTAHWGSQEDLADVLAAGVDGLEHIEPRGVQDGWSGEALDMLVKHNIPITTTLVVTDTVLPPEVSSQLRQRVGEFHAARGRIIVGSDAPINGVPFGAGVHRELELLVESGLTPQEAIRAATSESARVLQVDEIGSIESGRSADLVVVDGNPLQDIRVTQNVIMVLRDGRIVVDNRGAYPRV